MNTIIGTVVLLLVVSIMILTRNLNNSSKDVE